jgi:hypothetical protein
VAVSADTSAAQANLQAIIDKMNQIRDKTVHVNAIGGVNVNGAAVGGTRSGVTLVGEEGPELVDLPNGSFVHTNSETRDILNNSGPATSGPANGAPVLPSITVNVNGALGSPDELSKAMIRDLTWAYRTKVAA